METSELLLTLGRRIRVLRTLARLTQAEFAERAKLSYKYFCTVERGQRNVTVEVLLRIANALEVEPWELLRPLADGHAARPLSDRFLVLLEQTDSAQQEAMLSVLESFRVYRRPSQRRPPSAPKGS